jgi:aspartate/methionine/tyrosine aminotransferase
LLFSEHLAFPLCNLRGFFSAKPLSTSDSGPLLFWSRGVQMMQPSSRIAQVKPSPIRMISEGAPADAIPLGLGEPTWELPLAARKALARESGACAYGPNAGLLDLRKALGSWHSADVEEVLVTSGSEEALFSLVMAWLESGDQLLIPDPGFTAYPVLARIAGAEAVLYPLDAGHRYRLDTQAFVNTLNAHPKVKAAILNFPCNPTGGGASLEDLRIVAQACQQRGILLISDEVYRDLYFGMRPPSLRDASDYGIVTSSISKGWAAPGLRVGWAVGDPTWLAPARTMHAFAVTAASATTQRAALALLEDSDEVLATSRREMSVRWEALASAWKIHFGKEITPPDGSFYHWVALPESARVDPFAFCVRLRDEGKVILVPGTAFGEAGRTHARLSFAASPEQLQEGVKRLTPFWGPRRDVKG